jgi:hypothetical protein
LSAEVIVGKRERIAGARRRQLRAARRGRGLRGESRLDFDARESRDLIGDRGPNYLLVASLFESGAT